MKGKLLYADAEEVRRCRDDGLYWYIIAKNLGTNVNALREWRKINQFDVIKLAREAKEVKEVISSNLTTSAPTKKREAIQNFLEIKGAKGKYFVLRSTVNYLMRDPNISKRHDIVDQYKPEFRDRNHRYFLRNTEQECTTKAHVDHILECQFLSHCIMQTECLHPVIKNIEISSCMSKQLSVVQNVLKPLYKIHNGQDKIASYFNLQLMDGNLNILKGEAVTDFIFRQYSTVPGFKKGPIDFVSHFKNSKLVRDGIIDADTLAGEVENTMRSVESPYLSYLENLNMGGETDKKKEQRSEELIQSMIQAFGEMFEGDKPR